MDCEIKLVTKKSDFLEAIKDSDYDLFLSDFRIPTLSSGFESLDIIKAKYPDIPVLFISGTIGEELAVELLKKGATDYILKDKLIKLSSTIKRTLIEKKEREERKKAQEALWESEERYRNLFMNSPIGIYRSTPGGDIIVANPSLIKLLGYSSLYELKKRNLENEGFSSIKERERFKKIMEENDEVIGFETAWLRKGGSPIYILENSKAIRGKDGSILFYEGTIEDITDRKVALDALAKSETQLNIAQEIAHIGDWELDVFWNDIRWSKGMYKIYGLDPEKVQATRTLFWETMHPEDKKMVKQKLEKEIIESEEGISFYYRIIKPDKEIRTLYCILKKEIENNRIRRIFGTVQDVTEQKKGETELIEAKKLAEESDRLKTDFLALMSHEIRTPLNTLFNLSHLVDNELSKNKNSGIEELFEDIHATGRRLIRTIELILNMATINTTRYVIVNEEIDITSLINTILKNYAKDIKSKKLSVSVNSNLKNPKIQTDEYLITKILDNLIDNAVKYTRKGNIEIQVCEKENKKISIDITDSGIGIAEKYVPNLFKPFTQESSGYARKYEGNGLGLALSKKYIELLNGEISAETKKGVGSTFSIILNG